MNGQSLHLFARSATYTKYLTVDQKIFMTMQEAINLSQDLAAEILAADRLPDLVVGLANGALLPTKIVADRLGVPFHIVHIRRKGSRYKQIFFVMKDTLRIPNAVITWAPLMVIWRYLQQRTSGLEQVDKTFDFGIAGKYIVVVDDAIQTGTSARYVKEQLSQHGAAKVRVAVICWYKGIDDSGNWAPDIYLHRKDQYYPWSNNSPYIKAFLDWLPANGLAFWK